MIPWILLALSVLSLVSVFIYVELEQPKKEYSISEEQMGEKVEICGKLKSHKIGPKHVFFTLDTGISNVNCAYFSPKNIDFLKEREICVVGVVDIYKFPYVKVWKIKK